MSEEEIIQKISQQTNELLQTIEDAEKLKLNVDLFLNSSLGGTKLEVKVSKTLFKS
jgi:hypothetical protein